jgi:hypothetical protein
MTAVSLPPAQPLSHFASGYELETLATKGSIVQTTGGVKPLRLPSAGGVDLRGPLPWREFAPNQGKRSLLQRAKTEKLPSDLGSSPACAISFRIIKIRRRRLSKSVRVPS